MKDTYQDEESRRYTAHLRMLRNNMFKASTFVSAIEGNLDWVRAKTFAKITRLFPPSDAITQDEKTKDSRPGIWKGTDDDDRYQATFNLFLHADKVKFHDPLFTHTPNFKEMILSQLSRYARIPVKPKGTDLFTLEQEVKWRWSGKKGGHQDDVCVALIQGLYHSLVYMATPSKMYPFKCVDIFPDVIDNSIRKGHVPYGPRPF